MTMTLAVRRLAALVLFAVSFPAEAQQSRVSVAPPYTVRITNDQFTSVRLYLRLATVRMPLGSLSGGESKCIALPVGVVNRGIAFEATNPYGTRVSDVVYVSSMRPSWEWTVRDVQSWSFVSVQPVEFGCER